MNRFFFKNTETWNLNQTVDLTVHYHKICTVLRLGRNEKVSILNGMGKEFFCSITEKDSKKKLLMAKIEGVNSEKPQEKKIFLLQALIKIPRLEILLQKVVELGVDEILPLITERTIIENSDNKFGRLETIIQEACCQCGRLNFPVLHKPASFQDIPLFLSPDEVRYTGYLTGEIADMNLFRESFTRKKKIVFIIGPEGDLSEKEYDSLKELDFRFIRFNKNILRTETAAISAVSILAAERDRQSQDGSTRDRY